MSIISYQWLSIVCSEVFPLDLVVSISATILSVSASVCSATFCRLPLYISKATSQILSSHWPGVLLDSPVPTVPSRVLQTAFEWPVFWLPPPLAASSGKNLVPLLSVHSSGHGWYSAYQDKARKSYFMILQNLVKAKIRALDKLICSKAHYFLPSILDSPIFPTSAFVFLSLYHRP